MEQVPDDFSDTCFVFEGAMTPEDCATLGGRITDDVRIEVDTLKGDRRVVSRTSLHDEELAAWLFEKLDACLPSVWEQDEEDELSGVFSGGFWQLDRIDRRIQLYRYGPGGVFSKHRDGATYRSADLRSFFTVLVYLNEGYTGGKTIVYNDDETAHYIVPNNAGNVFVMLQRTLHEGATVEAGQKMALRCDVLYKRTSGTAEDSLRGLSKLQRANKWDELGAAVELSGFPMESVKYYSRAEKLRQ